MPDVSISVEVYRLSSNVFRTMTVPVEQWPSWLPTTVSNAGEVDFLQSSLGTWQRSIGRRHGQAMAAGGMAVMMAVLNFCLHNRLGMLLSPLPLLIIALHSLWVARQRRLAVERWQVRLDALSVPPATAASVEVTL